MDTTAVSLKKLENLKQRGPRATDGLPDAIIREFLSTDPRLQVAIDEAVDAVAAFEREFPELKAISETKLIETVQSGYVNFYPEDQTNPYVPVAGRGPWIITAFGAVIHDSGGYGMIGFGHAPDAVLKAMTRPHVMANIMTPSVSQYRLDRALRAEIGRTRKKPAFSRFLCMNSGSEAGTVASRISDINAKKLTDAGGRHAGKKIMFLSLKGGFHGRTERPAQASDSSKKKYFENLATFRGLDINKTIEPNDVDGLVAAFQWADKNGVFFECMWMEPVMGEGDPGRAITTEFYKTARELTKASGTLLFVDSIQAAIRAHGCLSIVDYPGFQDLDPPDLESYSKAINGGQYPVSILAMGKTAAELYVRGVYGNTMTANPRALDIAATVLHSMTPAIRQNIEDRGKEFLEKFEGLKREFPDAVAKVQGTGLLVSLEVKPAVFTVVGKGELEEWLRRHGIGVIHGGANSLRFTPHFEITTKEVDLVISMLRKALKEGPRKKA